MIKELWKNAKEKLEPVREFIDGDDKPVIEPIVRNITDSEQRFNQLLENIKKKAIDRKIIRIAGEMYLPSVYKIYLSSEDFSSLLDSEKKFVEKKLKELILAKAKDLAGESKLTTEKIEVKIYEDGTLSTNEIEVRNSDNIDDTVELGNLAYSQSDKTIETLTGTIDVDIVDFEPLYYLEVWENEKKIEEFPILKNQITIGRDTKDKVANIRLKTEDKQISSLHTAVKFKSKSDVTVESLHKNITKVGKVVISNGKPDFPDEIKLKKDDEIQIFGFKIKLRF
jgi:Protein of unknown function (DUF3662)